MSAAEIQHLAEALTAVSIIAIGILTAMATTGHAVVCSAFGLMVLSVGFLVAWVSGNVPMAGGCLIGGACQLVTVRIQVREANRVNIAQY